MEGGRNDRAHGHSLSSEINVTPLVDVMLVVLIIFIVVTPMLQQGVNVALPPARNVVDATADERQAVTVVLRADGQMYLGTDPIDPVKLGDELKARHWADPTAAFQIKADQSVAYGQVKRVLKAGGGAGFRGAAFLAREVEANGGGGSMKARTGMQEG